MTSENLMNKTKDEFETKKIFRDNVDQRHFNDHFTEEFSEEKKTFFQTCLKIWKATCGVYYWCGYFKTESIIINNIFGHWYIVFYLMPNSILCFSWKGRGGRRGREKRNKNLKVTTFEIIRETQSNAAQQLTESNWKRR